MQDIEKAIIQISSDLATSGRWRDPDRPGSAHIKELSDYLNDRGKYRKFRESKDGQYFLKIIEAYEEAFNDDWLPFEIVGLKLQQARQFIDMVNKEVSSHGLAGAIPYLRTHYSSLRNQKSE